MDAVTSDALRGDAGGRRVVIRARGCGHVRNPVEQAERLRASAGTKLGAVWVLIRSRGAGRRTLVIASPAALREA